MLSKFKILVLLSFCFVGLSSLVLAASLEKAILLNEHGLTADAKRELIDLIFEKGSSTDDKAQAYYLLGNIAFAEDKIKVALNSWQYLANKYPNSEEAGLVRDKITELSEIVVGSAKESLDNAVARSYLRHAEFWSEDKSDIFMIDSSWISNVDAAIKWYDKIIVEFPKSKAARIAYEGKLKTLLGWKEPGTGGESYGIEASFYIGLPSNLLSGAERAKAILAETKAEANFTRYMPILLQSFEEFEKDHPEASTLQAFRYQIAQIYWKQGYMDEVSNTWVPTHTDEMKKWLNKIIEKAGDNDSFYRDLAERCLRN